MSGVWALIGGSGFGHRMLLAIDVGNTNTVFAIHDGERFVSYWRIQTDGGRTSDEYYVWLHQLMRHANVDDHLISGIIIATVAPQTLFNLRRLSQDYFSCDPVVVGDPGVRLGVDVRTDRPREVGADRVVNALAAFQTYGPNLIIVDFGTATTFDIVDRDGAYAGGVIAPGVRASVEALFQATSKLPRIDVQRPLRVVGKDTAPAMQSGVYWGYVGLIEGVCRRISEEMSTKMTVIATGGLAPLFDEGSAIIEYVDANLTMRGLIEVYRQNTGR
jgi:type III pantothenate kinase